jgi:hypothetical protein
LRGILAGSACLVALLVASCAKTDPTISRVEGSEPQRLSFGTPDVVQKAFTDQMKSCWFNGPSALLSGYQYDTKPAALETGSGLTELPQVTISSAGGSRVQLFVVQFYPFNDNTLISTRNISFPVDLAARMKRDVETWIFGRGGCDDAALRGNNAVSAVPQVSSSSVQHALVGSWSANQEPGPPPVR